jgi:hypothetical protein
VIRPLGIVAFLPAVFRFVIAVAAYREGAQEDIVAFAIYVDPPIGF